MLAALAPTLHPLANGKSAPMWIGMKTSLPTSSTLNNELADAVSALLAIPIGAPGWGMRALRLEAEKRTARSLGATAAAVLKVVTAQISRTLPQTPSVKNTVDDPEEA